MTTTATAADVLVTLQRAYDVVKPKAPHTLAPGDVIGEDLSLDSLEFIDMVSVLEADFEPEVVDAVIDRVPELRTIGDLVDAFLAQQS
jgi:acyl carrier protein